MKAQAEAAGRAVVPAGQEITEWLAAVRQARALEGANW